MKIENKSQSVVFHGQELSVEVVDMAEQGFNVLVWGSKGGQEYLARNTTIKGFDAVMAFVVETTKA